MNQKLKAEKRTEKGKKVKGLRKNGFVPGIVYGKKIDNIMVSINLDEFLDAFKEAGENTLIDLDIKEDKLHTVLIQSVDLDPVKETPLHVDFYQVRLDEKIKTEAPIIFEGVSPAVKELEGTLVKQLNFIEVESLPNKIPQDVKVDISKLKNFDDLIKVKDISVGEGVEVITDEEEVIALVVPPRSEEELAELEEEVTEDVTQVEGVEEEGEEEESDETVEEEKEGESEEKEETDKGKD